MSPNGLKAKHNEISHTESSKGKLPAEIGTDYTFKRQIVWKNALGFLLMHIIGIYGILLLPQCKTYTILWAILIGFASGEGITMGAHRLWSHKSYKAKFLLRLVLVILQTVAGQNCLYIWVRDHRQHHKYSDTDADPHNASRGFFFSHIGWLMSKKHPAVIEKGKTIDMSDLESDWVVMFQKKYYKILYVIFALAIPVAVPVYFFDESLYLSFMTAYMGRYIIVLNVTWCVNSVAHIFGNKPFDKFILPVESAFVSIISIGEGWHNYHHTFPWDYRAAELGSKYGMTTFMIDLMSYWGQAYDLRAAPYKMIETRTKRTGDGTHPVYGTKQVNWQDKKNITAEEAVQEVEEEEETFIADKLTKEMKLNRPAVAVQG